MIVLISLFIIGSFGSLMLQNNDEYSNAWTTFFAIAGSLWGLIFSGLTIISGSGSAFVAKSSSLPFLSFSVSIDYLSAFFIFTCSLITLFSSLYGWGYVKHYYKKYNIGVLGFFYHLFIAGMFLVIMATNSIFFIIVWEIMSIASYFLVVYDHNDEENVKAGFLYLIMTHIGTAFIISAFLLMYSYTGSFDFAAIKSGAGAIPLVAKNLIFLFAFIGFGTKAGLIPFHIWLPAAHPAAPSHVSSILSSVMIKTGIYMFIRIFLDMIQPAPLWWGLFILVMGSISSVLGVLFALTEHDIKKLLAYHSIENIGIILLGLGSALTFTSLNLPIFAVIGLTASLFHTLNHATFKSLLFLSAGSVINATHTRNMEEYGGLMKHMPYTAFFFLIGSMAISALPPFNGFFSEWLTFQALFNGIQLMGFYPKWIFIFSTGSLAFTGGLALACFVKAFGATFLARPRSSHAEHAKESSASLLIGMGGLALVPLLIGIFSGNVVYLLENVSKSLAVFKQTSKMSFLTTPLGLSVNSGFASVSDPAFILFLLITVCMVVVISRYLINRSQKETVARTWDCGTDLTPRMEITATGFARSIVMIFKGILKPSIQRDISYHDSESRYLPIGKTITLKTHDMHHTHFYQPLYDIMTALAYKIKKIQSGNTNAYILYIFIALIIALFFIL